MIYCLGGILLFNQIKHMASTQVVNYIQAFQTHPYMAFSRAKGSCYLGTTDMLL